ncbi:unnamed protein product [Didymodactylos carnosus]|uniref:Uncharacterized protein n=1 Tax=Didymodactylos carnosus TaxID=1234261 RepID=A0A8S2CQM6_9BILA|nr:unnamed protein product [Didymodactylos carnosus]CAF3495006.1 unnamed protein product [Didymodactylos carnosus]
MNENVNYNPLHAEQEDLDDFENVNNNNNNGYENDDDWLVTKDIGVFSLDPADRKVLKVADQRDAVQKKTFTKWLNGHLSKTEGNVEITDLFNDLRDGHNLMTLLEIFTSRQIPRERGSSKFHALQNVEMCLSCLEKQHNIRLVNIRPEEIVDGNPKLTLGLIWRIILHFQFSDIQLNPSDLIDSPTIKTKIATVRGEKSKIYNDDLSYRNMLLIWARKQCEHYPGIKIDDFSKSWRDGRAFLAILHRKNPQLVNMEQAYRSSNHTNLQIAFDTAQQHYGIAKLIDPEDVDNDNPDEKSIFLYISHLYKICPSIPEHPFQQNYDQISLESQLSYEYTCLASDLLKWIKLKLRMFNSEVLNQKTLHELKAFQNALQLIRQDEMIKYNRLLQRMVAIDFELQNLHLNKPQPDINSINLTWKKLEDSMEYIENELTTILNRYDRLKPEIERVHFVLNQVEQEITKIEQMFESNSPLFYNVDGTVSRLTTGQLITSLTDIQERTDNALNNCRSLCTLTQPNNPHPDVIQLIDRIEFLNRRVNDLNIHLGHLNSDNIRHTTKQQRLSGPSQSNKLSSPITTTTRIVDPPIVVQNKNNVDLVEYLNSCLNWVKQKQNTTDRFDLGSDLPSTITDIEQCEKLSNAIDDFETKIQQCKQNKHSISISEQNMYDRGLYELQAAYAHLNSSIKRLNQTLADWHRFMSYSNDLLKWISNAESNEIDREWTDITDRTLINQYMQQKKNLEISLEDRLKDCERLEYFTHSINREKHIEIESIVQEYMNKIRVGLDRLKSLLFCFNIHLKNAEEYNQFFDQVDTIRYEINNVNEILCTCMNQINNDEHHPYSIDLIQRCIDDVMIKKASIEQQYEHLHHLCQMIKPLDIHQRKNIKNAIVLCSYNFEQITIMKGETVNIDDCSNSNWWLVHRRNDANNRIPSVILELIPPSPEAYLKLDTIRKELEELNQFLFDINVCLIKDDLQLKINRLLEWDINKVSYVDISSNLILLYLDNDI